MNEKKKKKERKRERKSKSHAYHFGFSSSSLSFPPHFIKKKILTSYYFCLVLDLTNDDGLEVRARGLQVSLNLAGPFVRITRLLPVASEVHFKALGEISVHIPSGAGTVLRPFVRPELQVGVAGARARQPNLVHLRDEVSDSGLAEGRAAAVGGILVLGVLGPETVHGVGGGRVALLESEDVVVGERLVSALGVDDGGGDEEEDCDESSDEETSHFFVFFGWIFFLSFLFFFEKKRENKKC